MTFTERITEKYTRINKIEAFILCSLQLFIFGIGIAIGGSIVVCVLAVLCGEI